MTDPKIRFGELFKEGRERLGLKQEDAARELGVAQPTVSGWENGRTLPSFALAVRAARLIGLDPGEFAKILTAAAVDEEAATATPAAVAAG